VSPPLLVTSAGLPGANNLIRSLGAGDASLVVIGCHDDRFVLKKSPADRKYLVPRAGGSGWVRALRRIIRTERIGLVIPTTDPDVAAVSGSRRRLRDRVFLPRHRVIALCQDKHQLGAFLRSRGVPAPATYRVTDSKSVVRIFRRLPPRARAWCRIRRGAGALGAIRVRSAEQAWRWITFWRELRGIRATAFALSEYLPGRDFGCQSLWKDGTLVLLKSYERLSYLGTGGQPSEVSSIAALGKTSFERRVADVCARAVRALDAKASGIFSIDLREDARGVPCITEINAGRFSSATNIFDLTGRYNMAVTYVRLAMREPVIIRDEYDVADEHFMLRDVDGPVGIYDADDLFDEIVDARR